MILSNLCPNCKRYTFHYGDGENKTRYAVKAVYKELWKRKYGKYYLKDFYKSICPVCRKRLVVFEDMVEENFRMRGPIVFYQCTLSNVPYDEEQCAKTKGCHGCNVLKQQKEEKTELWYIKHRQKKTKQEK